MPARAQWARDTSHKPLGHYRTYKILSYTIPTQSSPRRSKIAVEQIIKLGQSIFTVVTKGADYTPLSRMAEPASDPIGQLVTGITPGTIYHHRYNKRTSILSINTLPLELIVMIFGLCDLDRTGNVTLVSLQLVCRNWKAIIDGTASLWQNIRIELVDNKQVQEIHRSLQRRLETKYPMHLLHIEVYLGGQQNHSDGCNCEETRECDFQTKLCLTLRQLLAVLIGTHGCYMARWASFVLDIMEWDYPGSLISSNDFDFQGMFANSAPLLQRVELWALNTTDHLFTNAPSLFSARLMDCGLQGGISLSNIRELWIDHIGIDIPWTACAMVEELTLRIPREMALGEITDGFTFPNIKILRLLGHVSVKVLNAVGDCHLEQLVLRVNSPVDLQRVINSSLQIKEIREIVLGGFFIDSYSEDLNPRLFGPEARKAALVSFIQRNGNRLDNITLLGDRIEEELEQAGFDVEDLDYWDEERELDMIGGEFVILVAPHENNDKY